MRAVWRGLMEIQVNSMSSLEVKNWKTVWILNEILATVYLVLVYFQAGSVLHTPVVNLICISFINEIEHLLKCSLDIYILSFMKCLFKSFCHLLFFKNICKSLYLYIPLYFVDFLFLIFMMSFDETFVI